MGLYSKQGLYASYKKNNAERESFDYYATQPQEVTNILQTINDFSHDAMILDPCAGGGHMLNGIMEYMAQTNKNWIVQATDIKKRSDDGRIMTGEEFDFLSDSYPISKVDYVIMNPPFTIIEPFVIRALEIAQKGLIMLGRIQFPEGQSRYETILKDNPPTDVYVYVDRIYCGKNGDFSKKDAIQAYAWFYWNKTIEQGDTQLHWIRRI